MGAWGGGGFENDTAADFASEVESVDMLGKVLRALPRDGAEIDADDAQRLIAAAECVAAMMGRPADDLPPKLAKRLATFGPPGLKLIEAARSAVSRVLSRSELTALWVEDDPEPFNRAVTGLIERLNPAKKPKKRAGGAKRGGTVWVCSFCDTDIVADDLYVISIAPGFPEEGVIGQERRQYCHLACLNGRLHPKYIVQAWRFDPDEI